MIYNKKIQENYYNSIPYHTSQAYSDYSIGAKSISCCGKGCIGCKRRI